MRGENNQHLVLKISGIYSKRWALNGSQKQHSECAGARALLQHIASMSV
jgi:hypothetical protein